MGLAALSVLIVDDNATTREVLRTMLDGVVAEVSTVAAGDQAIAALAASPVDIIIIDAKMPGLDGLGLLKKLRENNALAGLRVILLHNTDQLINGKLEEGLGVAVRLFKPVSRLALLATMQRVMVQSQAPPPTTLPDQAASRELPTMRILLVEDDPINQTLALALLEDQGYAVSAVGNGRLALAAVNEGVDLVLMDVQMPEMDGLEATRRIRAQEQGSGRHLPIIAMTAHSMPKDRALCLEAGMDDYVAKPIHAETLYALLSRYAAGL
jgi:CheY-like chemotaxis protein